MTKDPGSSERKKESGRGDNSDVQTNPSEQDSYDIEYVPFSKEREKEESAKSE